MKTRGYKLLALMKKDIKIYLGNKNQILIAALPIMFALFYQVAFSGNDVGLPSSFVLLLCAIVNLSSTPISVLSMMVAEEKEKNTMRTLMLSDVSAMEFLLSKTIIVFILMELISVLIFFICATSMVYFLPFIVISTISSFAVIFFGGVIGLIAKDQMATGTYAAPIMMLLMLPPLTRMPNGGVINELAKFIPTTSFFTIMESILEGNGLFFEGSWICYFVLCVWIIFGAILFVFAFQKKGIDN